MIRHTANSRALIAAARSTQRSHTFQALYATVRGWRKTSTKELDDVVPSENDFILSILRANPSLRDSKSYLQTFGPRPKPTPIPTLPEELVMHPATPSPARSIPVTPEQTKSSLVASILNPVHKRTALVKVQGPFTDVQLDSITRGLVYLEKLGLVSVIVVENDDLARGDLDERKSIIDETMRVVSSLEKHGARARPVVGSVVRLGPKAPIIARSAPVQKDITSPEAHTLPADLIPIRSALRAGEIPVVAPFALDSFCRSVRVDANDVIAGLAQGMVEAANLGKSRHEGADDVADYTEEVELTPLRLMIIDRHGGVPSYARSGYPHLLINLSSEYDHIHDTFKPQWRETHPTALANLALACTCLTYMPPTSSAIMVSHKSPSSLIANLITNKPAVSSSLPHALLQANRKLTQHTPTLIRRGLPMQVLRSIQAIDKKKLKHLLEQSFGRNLNEDAFYKRLEKTLDFAIVAGDYSGAAIVTNETCFSTPISYLDKFAVLPQNQGDGTVDFLWVALHDESYGLGHPFSANPNGGRGGKGEGRDLVWRSRANNPVNKWYFERSSGHLRLGSWVLFWCDAEKRLKIEEGRRGSAGLSYVESWEEGRLPIWAEAVEQIPSSWK